MPRCARQADAGSHQPLRVPHPCRRLLLEYVFYVSASFGMADPAGAPSSRQRNFYGFDGTVNPVPTNIAGVANLSGTVPSSTLNANAQEFTPPRVPLGSTGGGIPQQAQGPSSSQQVPQAGSENCGFTILFSGPPPGPPPTVPTSPGGTTPPDPNWNPQPPPNVFPQPLADRAAFGNILQALTNSSLMTATTPQELGGLTADSNQRQQANQGLRQLKPKREVTALLVPARRPSCRS